MRTVDVVKRSKTCNRAVNVHGMNVHATPATQEYPVWVGPTYKHLKEGKHACMDIHVGSIS